MQTDSVLVDTKDAEKVLVTKNDFEHALTYDVKPVSGLREPITIVVDLGCAAGDLKLTVLVCVCNLYYYSCVRRCIWCQLFSVFVYSPLASAMNS